MFSKELEKGESIGSLGRTRCTLVRSKSRNVFCASVGCTSVGDVESIARIDEVDDFSFFNSSLFVLSSYGSTVEVNGQNITSFPNISTDFGPIQTFNGSYQIHRVDGLQNDVSIVVVQKSYTSLITMRMTQQLLALFTLDLHSNLVFILNST